MNLYEILFTLPTCRICVYADIDGCFYSPFTDKVIPLCDVREMCFQSIELGY